MKAFIKQRQEGASAIEFAILLPFLCILVFGIIEFSILFYDKAMITNASREGARAGIVYNFPDRLSREEIEGIAESYCAAHLISFGLSDTVDVVVDPDPAVLDSGDSLTVTVVYPYTFLVLPSVMINAVLPDPLTLRAVTVMRME